MRKWCKKSSLDAVANALRVQSTASGSLSFPNGFVTAIKNNMVIPTNRGSYSDTLTTTKSSVTLPRGVYSGGSVGVTPQSKTVDPQTAAFTVNADSGKALTSVTVRGIDAYSVYAGTWTASDASSFSVSGLSFKPEGAIIVAISSLSYNNVVAVSNDKHSTSNYGVAVPNTSSNNAVINNAGIVLGNSGVTCSGLKSTYSWYSSVSGNQTVTKDAKFNGTYYYCIWGK